MLRTCGMLVIFFVKSETTTWKILVYFFSMWNVVHVELEMAVDGFSSILFKSHTCVGFLSSSVCYLMYQIRSWHFPLLIGYCPNERPVWSRLQAKEFTIERRSSQKKIERCQHCFHATIMIIIVIIIIIVKILSFCVELFIAIKSGKAKNVQQDFLFCGVLCMSSS